MASINVGDGGKQGKEDGGSEQIRGADIAGISGPWVGLGFIFLNRTNLSSGSALKMDFACRKKSVDESGQQALYH